jgi:hypothetical protein
MRKSTIIAQCLVNSDMVTPLEHAEVVVRATFEENFPDREFADWNQNLDDSAAAILINDIGRASQINVKKLIERL